MAARQRKCKAPDCGIRFTPRASFQKACSPECALTFFRLEQQRRLRREQIEGRKRLRTLSDWMKLAQTAFNAYIRERDESKPCISCGRFNDVKRNAGHYLSVGSHPELRFHEDNCHAQCEHCNTHKSGNAIEYRINLIHRVGLPCVEWLEGPHPPKRYRIEDLQEIRETYKQKLKELRT